LPRACLGQCRAAFATGIATIRKNMTQLTDAHAADPELSKIIATELPRLGDMAWRSDMAAHGIAIADALLLAHAQELRDDLDVKVAAYVVAKASEAILVSITQSPQNENAAAIEQALLEMQYLFLTGKLISEGLGH
jgi:Tetracyclin repressor-like, C-terminal domain